MAMTYLWRGGALLGLVLLGTATSVLADLFPLRGPTIDLLWRAAEHRSVTEIRDADGEAFPLFQEIRRRGSARELPLVVETLRAFADGRLRLQDGEILAGGTRIVHGFDLTPEIEGSLAKIALA